MDLPDLIVDNIWIDPNPPSPGGYTTIAVKVRNSSSVSVPDSFRLELYIDGTYQGRVTIYGLDSWESDTTYWNAMTWPTDTASHTITAMVDTQSYVPESNEGNNSRQESYTAEAVNPTITGLAPSNPLVQSTRQWIEILGTGFIPTSEVTLWIDGDEWIIPADRTEYVNAQKIKIYVGLTQASWLEYGGLESGWRVFRVVLFLRCAALKHEQGATLMRQRVQSILRPGYLVALLVILFAIVLMIGGCFFNSQSLPETPADVAASDGTMFDEIEVTWGTVDKATSFEILRSSSAGGAYIKIGSSPGQSLRDVGMAEGTVYWYKVQACNAAGCGDLSSPDSGFVRPEPPPPPG